MTAPAQMPSEPTCPVCAGTGRREVTSFSNPRNTVGVACIACKGTGKLEADWKAHADSLQAECNKLKFRLNHTRRSLDQAERKLAKKEAALRKYGRHAKSCDETFYSHNVDCTCGFDEAKKGTK